MAVAVQFAGIALAALIIGTLPVVMALSGNRIERTVSFKALALPLFLILVGLASINALGFSQAESPKALNDFFMGALLAFCALGLWSYYGVQNALYLKDHADIGAMEWANAIGVACLIQVSFVLGVYVLVMGGEIMPSAPGALRDLIVLSLIMGVFVSWLATHWWNLASRNLPIVLVGQLIVFETISSLIYEGVAEQSWPHAMVWISAVTVVFGVILSIRRIGSSNSA